MSDGCDVEFIRSAVKELSRPSTAFGGEAVTNMRRLLRCALHVQEDKFRDMAREAQYADQPMFLMYSSDGWGTDLHEQHAEDVNGFVVRRAGRVRA